MKRGFHVFFPFFLVALFAVLANAAQLNLQTDPDTQEKFITMSGTGTDTFVVPSGVTSFNIYDDGGKNDYYSNDARSWLVLEAPSGYMLSVSGTMDTESNYDFFEIWNGAQGDVENCVQNCVTLFEKTSGFVDITAVTGKTMTLYFTSDGSNTERGLELTVTVTEAPPPHTITLNSVQGGTISSDVSEASQGDVVTLTLTPTGGNYVAGVSVSGGGGPVNVSELGWYSGNVATFIMPPFDVSVTPQFVESISAAGSYINLPHSGTKNATIPEGVTSFKVYDDGGQYGVYGNAADGTLVLTAPAGKTFMVTGQLNTESGCDYLFIYDGDADGNILVNEMSGNDDIGNVFSTGNVMTLYFSSDGGDTRDGLDLTVLVVDASTPHTITLNSAVGGTISSDMSEATMGKTVTLTLTPSGNNLVAELSVMVEGGGTVETSELEWYVSGAHTVSFTMPAANVSVNAVFAENVTAESGAFINLPASGTKSVTIPASVTSFKVYDDGGISENYSNGAYGSLVLTAPVGFKLQVTGIVISESGYDELTIYEGDDELSENPFTGYGVDVGIITSNGNEIRIFFNSDESKTESGLDLTVTLVGDASASHTITLNGAEGGTISSNVSEAMSGETVTLTLTPSGNNLLAGVAVVTSTGDTLENSGVVWYASGAQTVTFTMPALDVSVSPLFTSNVSVESGAYINMPATGTRNIVLPAGVTSFKVYDDGGKYDDYGNNVDGKLVLTVPEGKVLMVNGHLESEEGYDFFSIYDGDENATPLVDNVSGENVAINAVVSTGNVMTLYFLSDEGGRYSGLDLTVMVVDPNANYSIALNTVTGGSVSSTKTSAKVGERIVLTLSPDANYMLNGLEVKGTEDELPFDVGEVQWYSGVNTISFTMPNKNLTVTPSFTNVLTAEGGLYINMPKSGTLVVNVPAGVQSFKVYDDGGKDAGCTFGSREAVELRAPVGFRLQVEGSITSNSFNAQGSLNVLDGNSGAESLLNTSTPGMGGTTSVETTSSSENVMTLYFSAAGWVYGGVQADLNLTVTLVPAEKHTIAFGSYTGGTIASDVSEAFPGETVTLTAHSATNYLLAGISVENMEDHSVDTLDATWNVDNTVTFAMPNANVKVTPIFTDNWTDAGGLYLRLPAGGSVSRASVPAGVTSFKVYATAADYEHCLSDYSSNNVLEIASAEGKNFLIEGEISDDSWLVIYDGQAEYDDYPLQYRDFYGNTSNNIGQYQSGGDTVTIGYNLCEGLDLTVTVGGTATEYTITLADADGGAVYSSMDRAYAGESVDLRFGHDATHVLEDVRVEDGNGNSVVQLDMKWYSRNYKTFIMPFSDVVVTPVFMDKLTAEDGLFIDMQNNWNTVYAVIPDNVKSFKVYDDGGSAGNYSLGVHSELTLEAPSGYALKLTGTMTVSQEGYLSIYDNDYGEHRVESTGDGVTMDVGPITGHYLQLYFNDAGKYGETYSGLDLTVTLVRSAQYAAVSVEDIDGEMVATIDGAYNYVWGGDVYIPEEIPVDTVIFNRDFSTSGYSTIVLPFDINVSSIDGLKNVYEFDGIGLDASGKKEARMVDASSNLKAYTPYMIELEDNQLVFHGKLVLKSTEEPEVRKGDWVFRGALGKITWDENHSDLGRVYGFAASQTDKVEIGQFVKAGKNAWINPFRAYMVYEPEDGPSINKSTGYVFTGMETLPEDINVVIVSRDANGEEHKKVIGGIDARTGEFKMLQTYDLKGRKLNSANGKPEARGVYYGKKKVVK